jgi:hypothetical protein
MFGIHQAADRRAEIDAADIEQHQRQQEVGDGEADEAEEGGGVVAEFVLMGRGIDADDERHDPDEDDGGRFHHDGKRQPLADQVGHRHGVLAGKAEVPAEDAGDPGQVAVP